MARGAEALTGVVADADVRGQRSDLNRLLHGPARLETWLALGIGLFDFAELGLEPSASDRVVWMTCQERRFVLLTGNRNREGPDSLAMTIDEMSTATSLPVITIGAPARISQDRGYASAVADDLLEYLYDMENLLGTRRLYVPRTAR
jgi:hypothetical protein